MFEKELDIIKNNNHLITVKQAEEHSISRNTLCEMTNLGLIERVENGVYVDQEYIYDELEIFSIKHKNIIFSHNTAAYLLHVSERAPEIIEVSIKRESSFSNYRNKVKAYRLCNKKLNIGKIEVTTNAGKIVNTYNLERTFVDLIVDSGTLDNESRNFVFKKIVRQKNFHIDLMLEYSKYFKVYEKAKLILELLT